MWQKMWCNKYYSDEEDLQWKMTSNFQIEISQKPLVRSSPNFKLKLIWTYQTINIIQMKTTSNGRWPQISKIKYLSNHWSDLAQIWNLSSNNQTKLYKCFKWRWPQIEDNLKYKKWNISATPGRNVLILLT